MAVLELSGLGKSFAGPGGPVRALDGVSLALEPGDFVVVQGPSGCGKSTLLLAAGGLLRPDQGAVRIDGQDVYDLSPEDRSRFRAARLGFVFQQFHLVPYLDVLDNILVPTLALPPDAGLRDRALGLAERFGMTDRLHHVPAALSVGERQRTALARALLNRPALLLADEPTGNLDAENGRLVLEALAEFARNGGAVLLVTHDEDAGRFAQRRLRLQNGRSLA
jgi:ABC-type lipoprotein export system ATPase subunit